ncbi:MAG: HAMP domain-containing histidine kinase [Sphingobacteriales bacterium]|nr:MAG: HAMP domain-containing histidine kinase [Sphingobacteriales bacterium]
MSKMISGFLDVARFESGKIYLNMETCNLTAIIAQVIDDYQAISSHSHNIQFNANPTPDLHADYNKIQQVVENLLSNALKYSPPGSDVTITCYSDNSSVQMSITNEGEGIALRNQDKLFSRFYRANQNQQVSGFGIGLYLCAEIVASHRGSIWVESDQGEGATFHIVLPVQAAVAAQHD